MSKKTPTPQDLATQRENVIALAWARVRVTHRNEPRKVQAQAALALAKHAAPAAFGLPPNPKKKD